MDIVGTLRTTHAASVLVSALDEKFIPKRRGTKPKTRRKMPERGNGCVGVNKL